MSRGGRTAAALLAVVVMIGAAVLVRGALDGGDSPENSTSRSGADSTTGTSPDGRPTLGCAKELEDVCTAIAADSDVRVVVQPSSVTAARLGALSEEQRGTEEIDGWLTVAPQPKIVDDAQRVSVDEPFFAPSERLARSPLVFVVWKDRLKVLATRCGSKPTVTWSCIGELAGAPWTSLAVPDGWGDVKLGHADPSEDAIGLLALGQEATSKIGHTDLTSVELDDPDFSDWLVELERQQQGGSGESPLASMLLEGRSRLALAQVSEAEACTRLRHARERDELEVVVPSPVTTADVVYAPRRGAADAEVLRKAVTSESATRALVKSGWRVGDGNDGAHVCDEVNSVQLGASDNVPDAGDLVTIRELAGSS